MHLLSSVLEFREVIAMAGITVHGVPQVLPTRVRPRLAEREVGVL
jgi:hypothetical protein